MVLDAAGTGGDSPHGAAFSPGHASPRAYLASGTGTPSSDRLEIERRSLLSEGLSPKVASTILASRKGSTIRIYNATWKAFCRWCQRKAVESLRPTVADVLGFLQDGLDSGLRPATLRKQVAALASVVPMIDGLPLGRHRHISRFLRGAALQNPPQSHRFPTWRLHVVLSALTKPPFEPMSEVQLKWLRMKTVFLVAVTSAHRISELGALSVRKDLCIFHKDKVVLKTDPTFLPKVAS